MGYLPRAGLVIPAWKLWLRGWGPNGTSISSQEKMVILIELCGTFMFKTEIVWTWYILPHGVIIRKGMK